MRQKGMKSYWSNMIWRDHRNEVKICSGKKVLKRQVAEAEFCISGISAPIQIREEFKFFRRKCLAQIQLQLVFSPSPSLHSEMQYNTHCKQKNYSKNKNNNNNLSKVAAALKMFLIGNIRRKKICCFNFSSSFGGFFVLGPDQSSSDQFELLVAERTFVCWNLKRPDWLELIAVTHRI